MYEAPYRQYRHVASDFFPIVSDYLDVFIISGLKGSSPLATIYCVTMARLTSYSQPVSGGQLVTSCSIVLLCHVFLRRTVNILY